jgi:pyruvate,water dikinase
MAVSQASLRESFSARTDEEVARLVTAGLELESLFGGPQDIEWAVDREKQLFIFQCRPLQVVAKAAVPFPEPEAAHLLQGGICASRGIGAARVQVVDERTVFSPLSPIIM